MVAIRRILAPTDFDICSAPTVRYAAELAEKFGAELILLHIVQDLTLAMARCGHANPRTGTRADGLIDAGKTGLENLVKTENLGKLNPKLEVRVGSPAGEIVAVATDMKADLVCIGTHGRGGIAHFLLGSVAEKVVRHAPCPVLTIRPQSK